MIKLAVHFAKIVIATAAALLFGSCNNINMPNFQKVDGDGHVTTQTRNITSNFTSISASRGLEIVLVQAPETKVTVKADSNLQGHIKTEVVEGELQITSDVNIRNAESKTVYVALPKLDSFQASSGVSVSSTNMLRNNTIAFSSSSGSNITVKVSAETVSCESSSGSEIKITGEANRLETDSSSGSSIVARDFTVKDATADASSGSSIVLNATQSLTAEASSGSSVSYIGSPSLLKKKVSSGGSVSPY